ncbi:MAG: copper amine oxidase N-terminal domain-containing protein [Clostridia bacterium]|nr:copper amine oxidase N-terminal domain-containing protein [Clostridia bacterium]
MELIFRTLRLIIETITMEVIMKTIKTGSAFAFALSLTIILTTLATSIAAFAQSPEAQECPALISAPSYSNQLQGEATVKQPFKDGQLLVELDGMDIALIISEQTLLIDSKTGLPASLETLKADDKIFAYYSAAMTRSLPPQSQAIAIVTQIEESTSHAELFTVGEIISRENGDVRALNKEGSLIVTFLKENPLTPFKTKQIVRTEDIQVGTQLFIWYDIVLMSYLGQTAALKAVLVGQEDIPMVPLRSVAEGLGFTVIWNGNEQSIFLDNGIVKTTLYIGQDSYFKASSKAIGLTQNFSLGKAPVLIENTTYVPASLFDFLN